MKNSFAIFHAGFARSRVKYAVIDYVIQIQAADRGLSQRKRAVTLEKRFCRFQLFGYKLYFVLILISVWQNSEAGSVPITR